MKLPLEVVVRGPALPPVVREEIAAHAARLDHFHARIMRARVTLEGHGHPTAWALRIALTVPGRTIVVSRQKGENVGIALREGFDAAARRLEDYVRRRRGWVKSHSA